MDNERRVYALIDDTIAREIERALQVRPGPAFLAAVRARIAEEPARAFRMHRMGWGVLALACALLAGFAAALQRVDLTPGPGRAIALVPSRTYVSNTTASLRHASVANSPVRFGITNQPEDFGVLVAPDEAAALRRLLNGAPLNVAVAMETTAPEPSSPAATRDIVIPFIAIDLLESTKASEGGTP